MTSNREPPSLKIEGYLDSMRLAVYISPDLTCPLQDLAELVAHCLVSPDCRGVYNAVAPHVVTNNQFVKAYARTMGWVLEIIPTNTCFK